MYEWNWPRFNDIMVFLLIDSTLAKKYKFFWIHQIKISFQVLTAKNKIINTICDHTERKKLVELFCIIFILYVRITYFGTQPNKKIKQWCGVDHYFEWVKVGTV